MSSGDFDNPYVERLILRVSDCEIVYSRRKTCGVEVRDGRVVLRLPLRTSARTAELMLEKYQTWIENKIRLQEKAKYEPLKVEFGLMFPIFNDIFELKIGVKRGFDNAFYLLPDDDESLAEKLRAVYRKIAMEKLKAKVDFWSARSGLTYSGLKISVAKHRWGSCSWRGSINLTWRLLLLPEYLCDCVICHELAHRREMNHSSRFYAEFERIFPDCKKTEKELRKYKYPLDNWV